MTEIKINPNSRQIIVQRAVYLGGSILFIILAIFTFLLFSSVSTDARTIMLVPVGILLAGAILLLLLERLVAHSMKNQEVIIEPNKIAFFVRKGLLGGIKEIVISRLSEIDLSDSLQYAVTGNAIIPIKKTQLILRGNTNAEILITNWDIKQLAQIVDQIKTTFPAATITPTLTRYLEKGK